MTVLENFTYVEKNSLEKTQKHICMYIFKYYLNCQVICLCYKPLMYMLLMYTNLHLSCQFINFINKKQKLSPCSNKNMCHIISSLENGDYFIQKLKIRNKFIFMHSCWMKVYLFKSIPCLHIFLTFYYASNMHNISRFF